MGVAFLQPWVWLLALGVAVPVLVHLLSRTRSRQVPFPSLRFLEPTPLAATARRTLQDWPLLSIRVALVLAAVAALATPVIVTPARQAAWNARVARAIVLDDRSAPADDELRTAAAGAVFARDRVADAIADALRWLAVQRPVAREMVVFSTFTRGAVHASDLAGVPAETGIRLVRTANATTTREREVSRLELSDAGLRRINERLTIHPESTELKPAGSVLVSTPPISITATPDEQPRAEAALAAVLRRGLRLPPSGLMGSITVEWPGAVDALAARVDERLAARLDAWEPELMTEEELARLSRPVRPSTAGRPEDAGDRRAMWGLVLVLLGLETWIRRRA